MYIYPKTLQKYLELSSYDEKKDITFIFDYSKIEIKAHKLILEIVSPVFRTMFNGSFAEKDTATIHDIEPEIFQKLLDVIYLKPIEIESIVEGVALCNAAEMYHIEDLKNMCESYLVEKCSIYNCFYLYEKVKLFKLKAVVEKCLGLFNTKLENIEFVNVMLREMTKIDEDALVEFLTVNESPDSILYQIVEYFVEIGHLTTNKKALGCIRFLTMSVQEILLAKLLSEQEKLALIAQIEGLHEKTKPILAMPNNFSTNSHERHYGDKNSFGYRYFWLQILIKFPVDYFEHGLKRVSIIKDLFNEIQINAIKKVLKQKLNGKSVETNDFRLFQALLKESRLITWLDVVFHGGKGITLVCKDANSPDLISIDFKAIEKIN
uniref:CSON009758 protein n=1 Tax=Culicoides sonorensis TaxID=179676 RepID=A0A336KRB6_CULSO